MTSIVAYITRYQEPLLIGLALLVCFIGAFAAVTLLQRARIGGASRAWPWLAAAGLEAGLAFWSAAFIALLAFDPGVPTAFSVFPTMASLFAMTGCAVLGFALSLRAGRGRLWGGLVLGTGFLVLHATAFTGYRLQGFPQWNVDQVLLAGLTGLSLAALALLPLRAGVGLRERCLAAGLLALSPVLLHGVALSALSVTPSDLFTLPDGGRAPVWLVAGLSLSVLLAIGLAATGLVFDRLTTRYRRAEGERLQILTEAAFEGVVIHDEGRILDANPAFCRLIGRPAEALRGTALIDLTTGRSRERASYAFVPDSDEVCEVELRDDGGRPVPVEVMARQIDYHGGPAGLVICRDISERRAAEERIRFLANHDSLTGLPNRSLFNDRLEQALARARAVGEGETVALIAVDLDGFKLVNDSHGHMTGDRILTAVSERLSTVVAASDTAARLGGDEFGVILCGLDDPETAVQRAAQIFQAACGINPVSVGAALFPSDADSAEDLIRRADLALARVKSEGGNGYGLYEPSLDEAVRTRRRLENELKWGVDSGHLQNFYQPQVDTETGHLVGFEALVRWIDPERGIIPPGEFITLAEQTGLISKIGDQVLVNACTAAATWPGDLRVAVNLSPVQFKDEGLPERISEVLAQTGLAPQRLEIEVTEGVLIDDDELAGEILTRLKLLGLRISMDDFGTGYSSMSYLRRFPFDKIKVDRSFVRDVHLVPENMAIVRATLSLARDLGIGVTAEGVETSEELLALRDVACPEVQGFLIGRPMCTEDANEIAEAGTIDLVSRREKADARLVA